MPILVTCPGCSAKLNAPDSAAGKKVRCPKPGCGTLIPVPAPAAAPAQAARPAPPPVPAEVVEDDPPPRKAAKTREEDEDDRPRKKRRDDDEDDERDRDERPRKRGARDERDEDDDRPRKKRRDDDEEDDRDRPRRRGAYQKRGRKGKNPVVVVAIIIGAIVVLGGVGYGIYAMLGGTKSAPPAGWKEYTYKEDGFKAYFPKEPRVSRMNLGGGMGGMGGGPFGGGIDFSLESESSYACGDHKDPIQINVMVMKYKGKIPSNLTDRIDEGFDMFGGGAELKQMGMEVKTVRWLGVKATEMTTPDSVMRMAITDKAMYQVIINGKDGKRPPDKDLAGFFDNFVLVK